MVEYINSQIKLGVPRDTIKATLTSAGWSAADVEDTIKKVESAKPAVAGMPAMPIAAISSSPITAKPAEPMAAAKPIGGMANPAPQTIKVSDLVSASPASSMSASVRSSGGAKSPLTGPAPVSVASVAAMPAGKKTVDTFQASPMPGMKPHGSHGTLITDVVLILIILAIGGFAGFLFIQNSGLNTQLTALNARSSGVNSQLSALQAQVAASTTALTAQISTLTSANQELQAELSFLVAPTSTTPGATSTATVNGTVVEGKTSYVIMATYGTKIYVANSKSAAVVAALAPLLPAAPVAADAATATSTATSTAVVAMPMTPAVAQFTGTYIPGSDSITLTSVNGTSL